MRETKGIEFRAPGDAPSQEGWYYGRSISHGEVNPTPRYVWLRFGGKLSVDLHTSSTSGELEEFEWFGPVREVREASCP